MRSVLFLLLLIALTLAPPVASFLPRASRRFNHMPRRQPPTAVAEGGEWRQYIPLVTSGLVLADMLSGALTGNSVANSLTTALRGAVEDEQENASTTPPPQLKRAQPTVVKTGRARVDIDGLEKQAKEKAEMALTAAELMAEKRRDPIEEAKRRLDKLERMG